MLKMLLSLEALELVEGGAGAVNTVTFKTQKNFFIKLEKKRKVIKQIPISSALSTDTNAGVVTLTGTTATAFVAVLVNLIPGLFKLHKELYFLGYLGTCLHPRGSISKLL